MRAALVTSALVALAPFAAHAQAVPALPPVEALDSADARWDAGRRDLALPYYRAVVTADSALSSRAVFRLATILAESDRLDEAVRLHRLYVRLEPRDDEGRIALGRVLAWAARYDESIAVLDSVIARDSTYRAAVLGRARALAWAGRLDAAIADLERWLAAHPDDRDAALDLARTVSWTGRLDDAERRYRALAERRPDDAEAWTGLAQVLRWSGRPGEAADALHRALAGAPDHAAAREQLRWVSAELAPSLEPEVQSTSDSDRNTSVLAAVSLGVRAPFGGRAALTASRRQARFGGIEASATAARATLRLPLPGRWTVRGELGAVRLDASMRPVPPGGISASSVPQAGNEPMLIAGASASGAVGSRLFVGVGVSRAPFDETAVLISRGIAVASTDAEATLQLPHRLALSAAGGRARLTGGSVDNERVAALASLRWTARRGLSVATTARTFGYRRPAADGYFAPERYLLLEGSARLETGRDLGWGAHGELGLGRQSITPFDGETASRFAQRMTAGVRWRPSPGFEYRLSSWFANVATPTGVGGAEYRAWGGALAARLKL